MGIESEYHTIQVNIDNRSKYLEGICGSASILPGSVCQLGPGGTFDVPEYLLNAVETVAAAGIVAVENKYGALGSNYTNPDPNKLAVDIPYLLEDHIYLRHFRSGDVFLGIATGIIGVGSYVTATVTGTVIVSATPTSPANAMGYAMTASAATNDRLLIVMA